ncbi:ATP synthase subunit I [Alteromonas sp. C1M14]|uniref:ATP synthase subunit I n=1 Tax=Alteromonas sp. C1M14 TaxID=2841567 RepID=UPI001C07F2ED|nr:ATP synthase subunit I [Alteromonas sp. C1M14]MBU2978429.1 ATP synthase subunit I [Alteromonas sp. C1M14]
MIKTDLASGGKKLARQALQIQLLVVFLLVVVVALTISSKAAVSAAIGGCISIVPNFIFALFAFRYAGASKNELVVRSFSQGAKLRLVVAVILFVIAFKGFNAIPEVVFSAFAVTSVSYWLAMFRQK